MVVFSSAENKATPPLHPVVMATTRFCCATQTDCMKTVIKDAAVLIYGLVTVENDDADFLLVQCF